MTDREEREQVLDILANMRDWMETAQQINSTPERINALNYAISSIKTDLKYDLLYEGKQIADADKMITEDNSCLATIHTEGLDEEIRCVMCSNKMKSDRGCDGSCVVNDTMYKKVMDAIERRIQPTTRNDKVDCDNADCNNCVNHKYCDYESNNSEIPTGSTTKNNLGVDPIDRVELLRAMDTWDKFGFTTRYGLERLDKDDKGFVPYVKYDDMIKCVMGMPSATPQPKTGHWISHREHCENLGVMPSGLGAYEWCSNCDCGIDVREWHRNHYNYCPNCGADMKGEEE